MTKRQLKNAIKELENKINSLVEDKREWKTSEIIAQESKIQAAEIQQTALSDNADVDGSIDNLLKNSSEYCQILNNQIPQQLKWYYWIWSIQKTAYWLGRYDFELPEGSDKDIEHIKTALFIAIMYGMSGYHLKENRAYYVSQYDEEYVWAYPAYLFTTNSVDVGIEDGKIKFTYPKGVEIKKFTREEFALCTWRWTNVGNYVWYMQDALLFILINRTVSSNATNLTQPYFCEINDIKKFKAGEYKYLFSPLSNIKFLLGDGKLTPDSMKTGMNNIFKKEVVTNSNAADLLEVCKYLDEYFCNTYGIPITSAKNQSLSADANLSVSTGENIAKDHDWRIKKFLKQLGIEIEIESMVKEPQNENADKEGLGIANTEGDNNKEGVKND